MKEMTMLPKVYILGYEFPLQRNVGKFSSPPPNVFISFLVLLGILFKKYNNNLSSFIQRGFVLALESG